MRPFGAQSLLGELRQLQCLYLAFLHNKSERIRKARNRLDRAILLVEQPDAYVIAFDAMLMIKEDRFQEARKRLSECLLLVQPDQNPDDKYVELFCKVWLNIFDAGCGYKTIERAALRSNAERTNASAFVKLFLPHLPLNSLNGICGDRRQDGTKQQWSDRVMKASRTQTKFDF